MAKYVITVEDAPSGVVVKVENPESSGEATVQGEGARHLVLGLLFSAHALQRVGAGIARQADVQPIHRSTQVH